MRELIIDPEFRDKVPPLTDGELKTLEENIVSDGRVLVPLVTWNGVIIDGHNRYNIVKKHPEIPFETVEKDFANRYEAIVWICRNQLGRRNLTDEQKSYLLGKQYEAEKMSVGAQQGNANAAKNETDKMSDSFSRREQKDGTAGRIGKEYGVDGRTVRRYGMYANGIDDIAKDAPETKAPILSGEVKIPKSVVASYPELPEKEKQEIISKIKSGKYERPVTTRKENPGNSKESRETYGYIDSAVNDMYDTEKRPEYTIDDLADEIKNISETLVSQIRRALTMRSTLLNGDEPRALISGVLLDTENSIEKVRGLLK